MKTTFFYRVTEFLINFQTGQSFSNEEDFHGPTLPEARERAIEFFNERMEGMEERTGFFGTDFTSPENIGKGPLGSAFSITLFFVEETQDGEEIEYPLAGEDPEECRQTQENERLIYLEEGLKPPAYLLPKE